MARNTCLRSSGGSGSKSEPSVPFFHAPAPALPFPFNSSDEEEEEGVDGGGEEEERAAAAWAARFCESEAPNAVDAEAEAEWLARTATATAATAAPAGAGGARAAAAEGGRKRRRLAKKRRLGETQAGEGEGRGVEAETTNGEDDEAEGEEEEEEEGDEEDNAEGMLYIHNVMAYAQLNCPVNLDAACQTFGNAVYMPGIFESVRVDLRCRTHCIASINIFSNGKLTGTGANSVEELRHAMKKVGRRLQLHPLTRCPVVFSHFRVKNILGSFSFSSLLSLHALAAERGLAADYEPERFPAVKVRVPVPAGGVHKQQQAVGQEQTRGKTGEGNEKTGMGGGGGTGGQMTGGGVWSMHKQQQQDEKKEQQQVLHAAWNNSGNNSSVSASASSKDEVVTLHLFSTGNVTLFGGRSVESLQYALQCVLPFLYKCRARTD